MVKGMGVKGLVGIGQYGIVVVCRIQLKHTRNPFMVNKELTPLN